jgi:hypothetical protein
LDIVCYLFFGAWNFLYLNSKLFHTYLYNAFIQLLGPLGLTQILDQFDGNILRSPEKGNPQTGDIFRFNEKGKASLF